VADERRYGIDELAALGGVSRRTIRFYIQENLLPPPLGLGRGDHYTDAHLAKLLQIRTLQEKGLTIAQIRDRPAAPASPSYRAQPPAREAWVRVVLTPGVELHVSSSRRLPPPSRMLEAARPLIRDLEGGTSRMHLGRGSKQTDRRPAVDDEVKARLIELDRQYSLLASATSFVAVEERAGGLPGEVQLRKIPVAPPRGWGGLGEEPSLRFSTPHPYRDGEVVRARAEDYAAPSLGPPPPRLLELLMLQSADGRWTLDDKFLAAIGTRHSLDGLIGRFGAPLETAAGRWTLATWLALVWLEKNAFNEGDHWRLAARNALEWLKRSGSPAPSDKRWHQVAIEILA